MTLWASGARGGTGGGARVSRGSSVSIAPGSGTRSRSGTVTRMNKRSARVRLRNGNLTTIPLANLTSRG